MLIYKIIAFNEATGHITIRFADFAPINVELPIDENGNLPVGTELDQYLVGFIPTWHLARQERLANGISNANEIASLVEPEPVIEPTLEQTSNEIRTIRNDLLSKSDWTQTLDAPLIEVEKNAWAEYRQALRDIPMQNGFPTNIQWPMAPDLEPR